MLLNGNDCVAEKYIAVSDLVLHCLSMSHKKIVRSIWVNHIKCLFYFYLVYKICGNKAFRQLCPCCIISGQDIFTGGFAGALYGGVLCASSILHRNLLTDLKHYSKDVRKRKMKQ